MNEGSTYPAKISLVMFAICCALFLFQGVRGQRRFWHSCDFVQVYAGARCMFSNCDPYKYTDVKSQYFGHGGKPIDWLDSKTEPLLNPPTTMLVVVPFSILSFPVAAMLWLGTCGSSFCYACYLVLNLVKWTQVSVGAVCLLLLTSPLILMLGQTATLAVATMSAAMMLMFRGKWPRMAISLMAVSLLLKPHLVGLVVLYFLFQSRYRIRALQVIAAASALTVASAVWLTVQPASHNWLPELKASMADSVAPGGPGDPSPVNPDSASMVNLQVDTNLFTTDHKAANWIAWGTASILLGCWLFAVSRAEPRIDNDLLAIAGICCVALLPIYHRLYDTRLLLLTVPGLVFVQRSFKLVGATLVALTALVFLSTNALYSTTIHRWQFPGSSPRYEIFFGKQAPLLVSGMAILFILSSLRRLPTEEPADQT